MATMVCRFITSPVCFYACQIFQTVPENKYECVYCLLFMLLCFLAWKTTINETSVSVCHYALRLVKCFKLMENKIVLIVSWPGYYGFH